jgi:hypothetical protein
LAASASTISGPGRCMRSAAGTGFDRRRILYFSFSLRTRKGEIFLVADGARRRYGCGAVTGSTRSIALHRARARLEIRSGHPQFHPPALELLQDAGLAVPVLAGSAAYASTLRTETVVCTSRVVPVTSNCPSKIALKFVTEKLPHAAIDHGVSQMSCSWGARFPVDLQRAGQMLAGSHGRN